MGARAARSSVHVEYTTGVVLVGERANLSAMWRRWAVSATLQHVAKVLPPW